MGVLEGPLGDGRQQLPGPNKLTQSTDSGISNPTRHNPAQPNPTEQRTRPTDRPMSDDAVIIMLLHHSSTINMSK